MIKSGGISENIESQSLSLSLHSEYLLEERDNAPQNIFFTILYLFAMMLLFILVGIVLYYIILAIQK